MTNRNDDYGFYGDNASPDPELKTPAIEIVEMIVPLLEKLKGDPEAEYIHWKDRGPAIDKIIKKIKEKAGVE